VGSTIPAAARHGRRALFGTIYMMVMVEMLLRIMIMMMLWHAGLMSHAVHSTYVALLW
jgi:hypothetical protein